MGVADLADYPWDAVAPYAARAARAPRRHRRPVDRLAGRSRLPRSSRTRSPPRPTRTPTRRRSARPPCARRSPPGTPAVAACPASTAANVLPTVGSKELVALLPLLLGLGPGDVVVHPRAAYPTYEVGARLVGATPVAADDPAEWPDGHAAGLAQLARQPRRAGAGCRGPARRGRPRPRARRGPRVRRVLRRARLGGAVGRRADPVGARPARDRRRRARHPVGVLAQQAVEPRGLPRGVPRRRSRDRRAAR